ncbi:glycosyltransferase family 2 protein [Roseivivax marinus]|uniref:glycosyltransferase family 2 protein n=1 Tax=Roseivivax marinus TaxID=1379903 RepID=UPI00273ECCF5|nr:glycosyltransferase family 2 protein [Roseivivax marinus]
MCDHPDPFDVPVRDRSARIARRADSATSASDGSQEPIVSIVVVSYNTREMTLDCLRSVAAETRTPHEVLVWDNSSTDGSAKAIAQAFPDLALTACPENLGFAKANNHAARAARGRYILLLNPDTVVLDRAIDRLLDFARTRPEAGIWGGRTVFADGSLNAASCWGRMSLWSVACQALGLSHALPRSALFNPESYGGWQRDDERAVDVVSGCFFLIEAETWRALGGFDETFTMYGEEYDLCMRARATGAVPRITPEARIVHHVGASSKARAQKLAMLLRAKTTLIRRHFPRGQRRAGVLALTCWPLSRVAVSLCLARLTSSPRWRERHAAWSDVWRQRATWRAGYG